MSHKDFAGISLATRLEEFRGQKVLWVADEHPLDAQLLAQIQALGASLVSNRWDQVVLASNAGIDASFRDFDLSPLPDGPWDAIFFRVAKERAASYHVINEAARWLRPGGQLWMSGYKNEGIKTCLAKASQRLGSSPRVHRGRDHVLIGQVELMNPGEALDDQNYERLQHMEIGSNQQFWSKPGLFGWKKIDVGSEYLLRELSATDNLIGQSVLDLGCGYGYLACAALNLGAKRIVATDNCAAAILACQRNLDSLESESSHEVTADDCGEQITEKFDRVLCNPPFHSGFAIQPDLHQRFMRSIANHLLPGGLAWVVVNQFIRLQNLAEEHGLEILEKKRNSENQFDLYRLQAAR